MSWTADHVDPTCPDFVGLRGSPSADHGVARHQLGERGLVPAVSAIAQAVSAIAQATAALGGTQCGLMSMMPLAMNQAMPQVAAAARTVATAALMQKARPGRGALDIA